MLWGFIIMKFLCPLIAHKTSAAIIGPDTLSVNEDTFYEYGYENPFKGKIAKGWAYDHLKPPQLEVLARLEWNIYHEISRIVGTLNGTIPSDDKFAMNVKEYLEDFEGSSLRLVSRMETERKSFSIEYILTTNLLTPFLTVRRFRNYIRPWMERTSNKTAFQDSIRRYVLSFYKPKDGPFRKDFHYSMFGIIMPHFILDLKAQDIANGHFRGKEIDVKLKACHCLDIGVHGVASGMYPVGIEWLELTMEKIKNGDDSADLKFVTDWLKIAIIKHDQRWKAEPVEYSRSGFQLFDKPLKNVKRGEGRKWQKQKICEDKENLPNVLSRNMQIRLPFHLHWSLCKGDMEQSSSEKSRLFCWYEKEVAAAFKIGPLKVELLSAFPRMELVQFHGLISNDSFFDAIKSDVAPNLSPFSPAPKIDFAAISGLNNPELLEKIKVLAARVSGLRGYESDESNAQVTTYVPGGFSSTHEDWFGFDEKDSKKLVRVAAFMLYIEEPEQGGETSFPLSLAKSTPLKGSAILNFNLLKSGEKDKYAPHASCPMTIGRKWVVVKDMGYVGQTHLTCSKDRDGRHEFLVNGKSKYKNKIAQKLY